MFSGMDRGEADGLGSGDLQQLDELGITIEEVNRQIGLFEHPPRHIELDRSCRLGDGIRMLTAGEAKAAREQCEEASRQGRLMKFVPASGAASRMFQSLLWMQNECGDISCAQVARQADEGHENAREALTFMEGLEKFAFFDDLRAVMAREGLDAVALAARGEFRDILRYLLTPCGLNYVSLPKGLLLFHHYPEGSRTALEEHLVEAAAYSRSAKGESRVHLTVSPEHRDTLRAALERIQLACERRYGVCFQVEFSVQKRATDTLAVELDNRPFRTADGRLLFRPGGHGALIENLNDLQADIVLIQNVDNVQPDRMRAAVLECKRSLTGCLIAAQQAVFGYLSALSGDARVGRGLLDEALDYVKQTLLIELPAGLRSASAAEQRAFLVSKLDRPLRVCGVVRNVGEPGGGPFWVRGRDGSLSLQIVEGAQVDPGSRDQLQVYASATHFNPAILVCAVRDWQGRPFDLRRFVDPDAVFIARKSKDGRELKALERPGLWNGAMADWTTLFVEVPQVAFSPVKTVNDLLRPEHQIVQGGCAGS